MNGIRVFELHSFMWKYFIYDKPHSIPLSTKSQITDFWSSPKCPPARTYINHRATRLEGEEDVDVGAIGHSSAGGVGQEELQTANQVPGDAHFNGIRLAQHGDCGRKGALLERRNLNWEKDKERF